MKFYKQVCKLSNVKRFAALKLDREYSGADHSYRVAMLGMMIVDEYNSLVADSKKISVEEVLRKALIHDLEESVIGDIPTPVKEYPGLRDLLRKASVDIMNEQILDKDLINREEYLRLWVEDKEGQSGQVITLADKIEALLSAAYELKRGNKDLQKAFNHIRAWFNTDEAKVLLDKFPITKKLVEVADESESFKLVG
jgi:putative hydrolase of HD superfamily